MITRKIKTVLKNPFIVFNILICKFLSIYYSRWIDEGNGKIIITDPFLRLRVNKNFDAKFIVNGIVTISPHIGGRSPVVICLGINSILKIDGDFIIGDGVRIDLSDKANLYIGGKDLESGSGITADTILMCNKKIHIGKDFLCAWGVFISDSDWHKIGGQEHQKDVIIGDHVWVANNSSILKGAIIGNNSIIAGQSKIINKEYSANSLLAGIPAKVVKTDISWSRDII